MARSCFGPSAKPGAGFSGPAIIGDRMYTMGGDKEKNQEWVYALDLKTQKKHWSTEVGTFYVNGNGDGPRGTPTIDGDVLYCLGGHGDLLCVELADGKVRWHKELKKGTKDGGLAGEGVSPWGYAESPLIDGDKLICVPGGKSGAVAALDKKTGEVLWLSKELTSGAVYSSAMPADIGGVHQYAGLDQRRRWPRRRRGRWQVALEKQPERAWHHLHHPGRVRGRRVRL